MVWQIVIGAATTGVGVAVPLVIQRVIDGPVRDRDVRGLVLFGVLALVFGAAEALLIFVRRWYQTATAMEIEAAMRRDLYAHIQRLPIAFHDRWQSGQLLSRVTSDMAILRRFLSFGLVFLVINIATYVLIVVLLLRLYWPLGVLVAASAIVLFVISRRFMSVYFASARRMQDQVGDLATQIEESAQGVRAIRSFGRREHMSRRFAANAQRVHDTGINKSRLLATNWAQFDLVPTATLAVVLVAGAYAVSRGALTIGELVAFVSLQVMLIWPVDVLAWIIANGQEAMAASDRIYEVLDTEPTVVDSPDAVSLPPDQVQGRLRFEGVGFAYGDLQQILRRIDLDVRPGETVAIVGATGCGKTSLVSLVPRLYDVTAGRITIDGHDIRDLTLASLRRVVGVAFEDATLFSMSVRENLTLGRPDATDADIAEALEVAQAGFVYELPYGLDTRVGEQGLTLSGGQRQRLALARAVLGRPRLLVLDDPLSALDVHTEALVEEALARVLAGTTALLVVHRPSTVALADRVALLQDGVLAAVGTHSELLATVPAYRDVLSQAAEVSA
jgi:ATP-binding cassette subfamily B protein